MFRSVKPNKEDRIATLGWAPNGGLGRVAIGRVYLLYFTNVPSRLRITFLGSFPDGLFSQTGPQCLCAFSWPIGTVVRGSHARIFFRAHVPLRGLMASHTDGDLP